LLDLLKSSGKKNVIPPSSIPKISVNDLRSGLTTPHQSHLKALQGTIFYGQAALGTVDMWPLQLLDFVEKKKIQTSAPGHDTSVLVTPAQSKCGQEQAPSVEVSSQQKLACPNPPADASLSSSNSTTLPSFQLKQIPVSYAPREMTHPVTLTASLDKQKISMPEQIHHQSGINSAAPFNLDHNQIAAALKPAVAFRKPKGSAKLHKPNRIPMPIPSSGGQSSSLPFTSSNRVEGKK
jgi:hypothetical protein